MYRTTCRGEKETGAVMVLVLFMVSALMVLTVLSLDLVRAHGTVERTQRDALLAREVAHSGVAQALALIKEGGVLEPQSGGGALAAWTPFSGGEFYYDSVYDLATGTSTIRSWGRVQVDATASGSPVSPDDVTWDGYGYHIKGVEVSIVHVEYLPDAPLYFGNGGMERPMGGFDWAGTTDIFDSTTWGKVTSSPDSWQADWVPMQVSALDHPIDYLTTGDPPAPAQTPHPFKMFASQTKIGQLNVEAWFTNSAGTGDPLSNVTPSPLDTTYYPQELDNSRHAYAVDRGVPDVQAFSWKLWNSFKSDPAANILSSGSHSGTYGDLTTPEVTIVTGELQVNPGETFSGTGILVIRDDFDPNVDTNNLPSTRAIFDVQGTFEWTGLVIISGWAPSINVAVGGDATIVGSIMGEDSVQSGSEASLDSATIVVKVEDDFRLLYSHDLFKKGGLIHSMMPRVKREVVGVREL